MRVSVCECGAEPHLGEKHMSFLVSGFVAQMWHTLKNGHDTFSLVGPSLLGKIHYTFSILLYWPENLAQPGRTFPEGIWGSFRGLNIYVTAE